MKTFPRLIVTISLEMSDCKKKRIFPRLLIKRNLLSLMFPSPSTPLSMKDQVQQWNDSRFYRFEKKKWNKIDKTRVCANKIKESEREREKSKKAFSDFFTHGQ